MLWLLLACAGTEADPDLDRDGIPASLDCDDTNPAFAGVQDYWRDLDQDGFGQLRLPSCTQPYGSAVRGGDCDDEDILVNPGMIDVCNTKDDDCDGVADGEDAAGARIWYEDRDRDGFGDGDATIRACNLPEGYVAQLGDCDDRDGRAFPGAQETCGDGVDQDCEGHDASCWLGGRVTSRAADVRFFGDQPWTWGGWAAAGAGDLDGNGYDDVIVGAYSWSAPADWYPVNRTGAAFVWYGPIAAGSLPFVGADAVLIGDRNGGAAGYAVSGGSDVDGDGRDDVIVGSPYHDESMADQDVGAVYGVSRPMGVLPLAGAPHVVGPQTYRYLGATALDVVGDWDGDGAAEILASEQEGSGLIRVMSLPGDEPIAASFETSLLEVRPQTNRMLTGKARSVGDVDGDGLSDVAVAGRDFSSTGMVWLVNGPGSGPAMVTDAATLLVSQALTLEPGASLAGGDLDGDGYGDVVWGAPGLISEDGATGAVVVVAGPVTGDLPDSAAIWMGESNGDRAGDAVSVAEDVDGDGRDDLVVGSPSRGSGVGAAYIVLEIGKGAHTLAEADLAVEGLFINDQLGRVVAGAGDVNGDGYGDVLIGSPGYESYAGAAFLFFGAPR
jgi:hypothetical protein